MRTLAPRLVAALLFGVPAICAGQQVALRHYTASDGLAHNSVTRIFEDSRGFIWVATVDGVSRFDGRSFRSFGLPDGLPRTVVTRIGETNGVLWFATRAGQVVRANDSPAGPAFVPYRLSSTAAGAPSVRTPAPMHRGIFEERASDTSPLVVRGTSAAVSDIIEDHHGNLWIGTSGAGLFTAPAELVVNYTAADELPDAHVVRLVESRDGRIYAMTRRGGVAELREDGVEALPGSLFAPFHTIGRRIVQDERDVWWFRTDAGLFSAPGPALSFLRPRAETEAPIELPSVRLTPFRDSRGWIWEPLSDRGVSLCNARGCIDYGQADGIGYLVTSIAEDAFGRVYLGTARGVIRFDPRVRVFSTFPSGVKLAGLAVTDCVRDSRGRVWIATATGVSYVIPRPPRPTIAPPVYFTSVGDGTTTLPPVGTSEFGAFDIRTGANKLLLEFSAPRANGDAVRFQHRLTPRDRDWSAPHTQGAATYSALDAGLYTFEVRAVRVDGSYGPAASLRFRAGRTASSWWWAVAAGALLLGGARSFRQLQRADRGRDLAGVPLRVFGRMEQETEDGGRRPGTAHRPRLLEQ